MSFTQKIVSLPKKVYVAMMTVILITVLWNPIGFLNIMVSFGLLIASFLQTLGATIVYGITYFGIFVMVSVVNILIAIGNYVITAINSALNSSIPTGSFIIPSEVVDPVRLMWSNSMDTTIQTLDTLTSNAREYINNGWLLQLFSD